MEDYNRAIASLEDTDGPGRDAAAEARNTALRYV
jgi:hypothetical protein